MLYACHRHKTQLPAQRYAQAHSPQDGRRTQEDEITSTIFGPLVFMPEATRRRIAALLFENLDANAESELSIHFWPLFGNVEPDVVLEEKNEGGIDAYVIEVKWNAPLAENQVGRQIDAVWERQGVHRVFHCVLSKFSQNVGRSSRNLTWMAFKDRLAFVNTNDSVFNKWREVVSSFLDACNIRHFRGFEFACKEGHPCSDTKAPLFWAGNGGWDLHDLPPIQACAGISKTTLFWNGEQGAVE